MPACKSGSTSGWTCGVVTADKVTESVNYNGELLDVYDFHFSAFLLSGDSGGAIASGHYSIGVDSYGNMSSCDDAADDDAVAGGFAIVDSKYNAEAMFKHGFNLSINVGQPKFAKLAGQISGMVDAAAGAKVTVTVDGKSYVAIVGNAGAWTVRLPKALAPGSHKVTAVASLQSKGSDFTTTGAAASRKIGSGSSRMGAVMPAPSIAGDVSRGEIRKWFHAIRPVGALCSDRSSRCAGFASLCAGRVTLRDPSHSDDIPKAQ